MLFDTSDNTLRSQATLLELGQTVLQEGRVQLTKADIMALLTSRGVKFRKGSKKQDLIETLARHCFPDMDDDGIQAIVAGCCFKAFKNEDERIADQLASSKELSLAVDALAELDQETAQAFPEMSKAQKNRRATPPLPPPKKASTPESSSSSSPSESEELDEEPHAGKLRVKVDELSSNTHSEDEVLSQVTELSFRDVDVSHSPTGALVEPPPLVLHAAGSGSACSVAPEAETTGGSRPPLVYCIVPCSGVVSTFLS